MIAIVAVIAALAFAIEAALGFGSTVITATVGAHFVPLAVLLPAFVPLNLVLSSVLVARGRGSIAWRLLLVEVMPPVVAGAAAGMAIRGAGWLEPAFAVFVIVLAATQLGGRWNFWKPAGRPASFQKFHRPLLALGGLAHGLFGTGGPLVVYVLGRRLRDRAALRATLAVLWLVLNTALVCSFTYTAEIVRTSAVLALVLPVGLVLGERWHRRLPEQAVWIVLLVAGAALLSRV